MRRLFDDPAGQMAPQELCYATPLPTPLPTPDACCFPSAPAAACSGVAVAPEDAEERHCWDHFFSNITYFSLKARNFLKTQLGKASSVGFVETHQSQTGPIRRAFHKGGFITLQAPATKSKAGGTNGGSVTGVRPRCQAQLAAPDWAPENTKLKGHDWTAVIVRLQGMLVVIFNLL